MGDSRKTSSSFPSPSYYYRVLDLPKDASPDQVRKAYKSQVRRWHPDKNPPSSKREAEAKFAAITQAYEALLTRVPNAEVRAMGDVVFKRKPPPIEKEFGCTLEELFMGCRKEVRYTRDVLSTNGLIYRKEDVQVVKVRPGWKKGHRIVLEEKGDQRAGSAPSDVVLVMSERKHPQFKRVQNDLVLKVEVPLVNALTGWTFSFRRLDGTKMTCSFEDEIVSPAYEKVIKGEGMPVAGHKGLRGDLRIKFSIIFPKNLSEGQRADIRAILEGCT